MNSGSSLFVANCLMLSLAHQNGIKSRFLSPESSGLFSLLSLVIFRYLTGQITSLATASYLSLTLPCLIELYI